MYANWNTNTTDGVITAKLVFWVDYLLTGQVNYRTLILGGSGLVTILFLYFWRIIVTNKLPFYCLLPIALFSFNLYHENIFWAAALSTIHCLFCYRNSDVLSVGKTHSLGIGWSNRFGISVSLHQRKWFVWYVHWCVDTFVTKSLPNRRYLVIGLYADYYDFYWYYPFFSSGRWGRKKALKIHCLL